MKVELQTRIDAAVECNVAPDEYFSIWDEPAEWQLEALKSIGLLPRNRKRQFSGKTKDTAGARFSVLEKASAAWPR